MISILVIWLEVYLFWTDNLLVKSITLGLCYLEVPCRQIQETVLKSSWSGLKSTSWLSKWFGWSGEREEKDWGNCSNRYPHATGWLSSDSWFQLPFMTKANIQILITTLFGIYDSVKATTLTCESHWSLVLSEA